MAKLYRRAGSKKWYVTFYDGDGKRVRRPLDTDKREAERKLLDIIKEENNKGTSWVASGLSWEAFKEKYLAHSKGTKSEATHYQDRMAIRSLERYSKPDKLAEIKPELLERWKAHRRGEGKGVQTINREMGAIKALLKKAHEWGYLKAEVWRGVKKLKLTNKAPLFYTPAELKALLNESEDLYKTVILLGARAGLRRSEMYHLSWDDIDFARERLHVSHKPGWHPKGYKERWVPMPEDLMDHLKRLKTRQDGPWVLGERPSRLAMTLRFMRIKRAAGLKGSLHTLRHTYASHLVQAGVPLYTVSKLLGHSSILVTMIYAHLAPESLGDAVKKLPPI